MTTKPVHSVPDAWRRMLVLHAYPPDPRLHTFERGLRQLGHDVVAAGPPSDTVPIEAWREVDAELTYVSVDPEASLDEVFAATGGVPDWVLYLRPPTAFLPRGLRDCPVPTVAWFEEEFRYLDVFLRLAPYFDIVGTAYEQVQRTYASRGIDNGRLFNYVTAAWLTPTGDVRFRGRPTDVSFVGNTDSRAARLRGLDLEKLSRLAAEGIRVDIRDRVYLWDMMDVYARSKIVFQRSGQGPPHLTYRVGEAMSAGAMVLAKHPVHASGLPRPLVGGEHLVYYADFDEAAELIRHYLANEDERVAIAEAGHRYVREEAPWLTQVAAFLQQHVYSIPAHYAAARRARLARLDIDTRRAQLDRAYYFAVCGDRPDVARREIERIPDWWVDPEARGLRAATERGKEPGRDFLADVRFVLEQDAGNLATVSNYAVRTWQARDSLPREHTMRVVKQALDAFDMAPPREIADGAIEGIVVLRDTRYRLEVANAYLHLSGQALRARLHAILHAQLFRNYADLLEEDGDYAGALAAAQEAVAHVRDDGYAFAQLARVAHKMGRSRDAVRFLRHALVVEPYFSEAYCELGSLLLHSRRPQEAAEILEMAKLSHQRPDACRLAILLGLAVSRFRLRQVDRARATLEQGLDEIDYGYIDMGDWRAYRADDAVPMERLIRTREAMRILLEKVSADGTAPQETTT